MITIHNSAIGFVSNLVSELASIYTVASYAICMYKVLRYTFAFDSDLENVQNVEHRNKKKLKLHIS